MDLKSLPSFYDDLDKKYKIVNGNLDAATYTAVESNFVYSSKYARHRWFNYKEGFSPVLVERIFSEYDLDESSFVCDPFCGAGTTLTVAKEKGIKSIGFEVNPFASYISRVKTQNYTVEDLACLFDHIGYMRHMNVDASIELPDNDYIRRIFDEDMLIAQLNIRKYLADISVERVKELLYFAWLCTLEECSLYRKAGNGLKKKKNVPEYKEGALQYAIDRIENICKRIREDFTEEDNTTEAIIYTESAERMSEHIKPDELDLVLFSPPYANCFDYTKIYYLELWFGEFVKSKSDQKEIRMKSIRSHCHATWPDRYSDFHLDDLNDELLPLLSKQKLWTNRIPGMLNGYFADMEFVLKQIHRALKKGGHCAIVVSNSAYAGIIIPTDILLAEIAERIGFEVEEIEVERLIITSSQQYRKTEHIRKYLRESIVKLRK